MKLRYLLLILVLAPFVFGTQFYVLEIPVTEYSMRVGQTKSWNIRALNDPNEILPYGIGLKIEGPEGVTTTRPLTDNGTASKTEKSGKKTDAKKETVKS